MFKDAIEHAGADNPEMARQAIDPGCGDGTETLILLEHDWCVVAIDGEPAGIKHILITQYHLPELMI